MTDKDSTKPERENHGGRVVLLLLLVLAVLFGGAYVAAYAVAGDKLPRGTTVAGVDIGGRSVEEAVAALRTGLAERVARPVTVEVAGGKGGTRPVTAAEAGLAVDYRASVAAVGGERSWDPERLWNYYTGGEEREAVVTVDDEAMAALLDKLGKEAGTPPRNGDVAFRNGKLKVTKPKPGEALDPEAAASAITGAWLDERPRAELDLVTTAPEVDEADLAGALSGFANPAMSAPVTLRFGEVSVELTPEEYSSVLAMRPRDGELVPRLDKKRLRTLVDSSIGEAGQPVDATVRIEDGEPVVVPAKPGVTYRKGDIAGVFLDLVARKADHRTEKVKATVKKADRTTKEAKQLGIVEKVSSFSTSYPHAEYRNVNIGQAAENINGTILEPGETFSFNDVVGERTAANGFTKGYIISNGVYKMAYGGGVSQMATTLFNAMFFAGLEDVEHRPHSFYISRYPIGREATVVWGALDLRFRNDTDHGVLIRSFIDPSTPSSTGSVTVNMWSTDTWDITTSTSERYNFTQPDTRVITDEDCTPHDGYRGFEIDVTRYFHPAGSDEVVEEEVFHTTYLPSDTVICR